MPMPITAPRHPVFARKFGSAVVPTYNFSLDDITFTAGMAKRAGKKVFDAAPIVQGAWESNADDQDHFISQSMQNLTAAGQGSYDLGDFHQGTIVFWITPEWDGDAGVNRWLFGFGGNAFRVWVNGTDLSCGQKTGGTWRYGTADISGWVAGTTYCVVLRWDLWNTLDGTNYFCVSINDSHTFGVTSAGAPQPSNGGPAFYNDALDLANPDAIVEGATIYRRPLYDGTYGIDVGNGDEIALIYASGDGKDPTEITGSWDVCFCLPTNASTGALSTGTGEAWSHPHTSNLLGDGGFMLDGTYTNDGFADEGTPTAVAALAAAEKIFPGGYKVTSDAADEGIYKDYTCSAGDDFAIRAIGNSDGTSVPKAILYDQDNTAEIGSLTGSNASTRAAPDVFIFTGTAPAGCTTLRVKLINTDATASDVTYWHQVELYTNLLDNPSFEGGSAGDPVIPTGWTNAGLDSGESEIDTDAGDFYSGASALHTTVDAINEGIVQSAGAYSNDFHAVGMQAKVTSGTAKIYMDGAKLQNGSDDGYEFTDASWTHQSFVFRDTGSSKNVYLWTTGAAEIHWDDIYCIDLDDVSLTVTPASEANSAEESGIRVDGYDECLVVKDSYFGATSGKIVFNFIPRHGDSILEAFMNGGRPIMVFFDWNNSIFINTLDDDSGRFNVESNNIIENDSWDWSEFVAGTEIEIAITWNSTAAWCEIDSVEVARVTHSEGIDFPIESCDIYFGSNTSSGHIDGVFKAPSS